MSPSGLIAAWTPELDAQLREHFPTMPFGSLSFMLGRTIPAIKARAHKLRLKRDPAASLARRQDAGRAGYAAARQRSDGKPAVRTPPSPPPEPPKRPDLRETGPDQLAYRRRRLRAAADVLVAHGVEEHSAALAVSLIARGAVPGARLDV